MSDDENKSSMMIHVWDGQEYIFAIYYAKVVAVATYNECEDAMDKDAMKDCPNHE